MQIMINLWSLFTNIIFHTITEHGMHFIPLQKWYYIILCYHSCYDNQVMYSFISAVVWNAYHALQWYEMHTSANFGKSKTHIFSNK